MRLRKIIKIVLGVIGGLVVMLAVAAGLFIYKVKNGFPVSYETEHPAIDFPVGKPAILLFSKTTGFRHGAAIDASKPVIKALAEKNNWYVYETEEGGVFNPEQLAKFSTVIFNNSTGEVINDEQKRALERYVEGGGSLIGIHGAGDDSHHWDWYEQHLLGAKFSHHPLNPQFQLADVVRDPQTDSLFARLPQKWAHSDEWYVFFENPRKKGFTIVYTINGETINPNGNMLFVSTKNFGMGKDHPVAWYKQTGKGKTFYTSMGHSETAWQNQHVVRLLETALQWTIQQ